MSRGTIQPSRLHEAREYMGLTLEQVAGKLGCPVQLISELETGASYPGPPVAIRLGRLYRRPRWWLCGETRFQPSRGLLRKVEGLMPGDREAVLDFAEWLQGACLPRPVKRDVP